MIAMSLGEAAALLGAGIDEPDVRFTGVSTDTRTVAQDNLFVALKGPNFDGHDYIETAMQGGAVAAVVDRSLNTQLPLVQVEDTCKALGCLAAGWRARFDIPLVAVTGSNGKTTVKEMIAAILTRCGDTLVTRGNLNNEIGVPHTLFRLSSSHRYAVVEMGANHAGEIAYLTSLATPTVGVLNNAGAAHLEGFGSLRGVAEAKGELFAGLEQEATCVINADDVFADLWRSLAGSRRILSFGLEAEADVTARWQGDAEGSDLQLRTPAGVIEFRLPLPGRHNVLNSLAASAAAMAAGAALRDVAAGLAAVSAVRGRWTQMPGPAGSHLIDDTYNANPGSLRAGLELLAGSGGNNWLVLGDMAELGEDGPELHREMGELARELGIARLFTLGEHSARAAQAFGAGARHFDDVEALIDCLGGVLEGDTTLLVKGSRSMRLERVIDALAAKAAVGEGA